jgi:hypothetical protein
MVADDELEKGPATIGVGKSAFNYLRTMLKPITTGYYEAGFVVININNEESETIINRCNGKNISFAPVINNSHDNKQVLAATDFYLSLLKRINLPTPSAVLLDQPGGEEYFRILIAKSFPGIITALIRQDKQELIKYCRTISGMGHGLTPTGDDLIHGVFVVYSSVIAGTKSGIGFSLREIELSASTGYFGKHMLEIGKLGLSSEAVCSYLAAIGNGVCEKAFLERLLKIGSNTGFDLAIAITSSLKIFIEYFRQ